MCSHSSDLKLDWIQEGVTCLCLKGEGQNPLVLGGSELPPGGRTRLLLPGVGCEGCAVGPGYSSLTCLPGLWNTGSLA